MAAEGKWQFWIDRGGTFTDVVAVRPDGELATHKLLSENPEQYRDAAIAAIRHFLEVKAGEVLAVVGSSGAGKSTLVHLVPRFFDVTSVKLTVDGLDVRDVTLSSLRSQIGVVPQETYLFSATLADNLTFGVDNVSEQRMRWAADIAGLTSDIDGFPQGYQTIVGQRGITLSGGQKQRTAIARALMVDPRLLILDDALSAVDTYTEEEILARLRGVMRQRTSLIVSHRVSTVRDADRIFVLDRGRIVEYGRHDELVSRGGLYATLHRRQLLEEELAAS